MTAQEIEEWFKGRELPKGPVSPHKSVIIEDPAYFVQSQLYALAHVKGDKARDPLIIRLVQFKEWLEINQGP